MGWNGEERRKRKRERRKALRQPKSVPKPPRGIILRKLAYGPDGFTCRCGGGNFEKAKETVVAGSNRFIRHAYSCIKCKESYVFIPPFALPGGTIF